MYGEGARRYTFGRIRLVTLGYNDGLRGWSVGRGGEIHDEGVTLTFASTHGNLTHRSTRVSFRNIQTTNIIPKFSAISAAISTSSITTMQGVRLNWEGKKESWGPNIQTPLPTNSKRYSS